jgi:putative aminopeptidase FrvX
LKRLLRELCTSGEEQWREFASAEYAREALSRYARVRQDALGNIIGEISADGTHILLDAHLDTIGLIVTDIDKTGFLRFSTIGKVDLRLLSGAQVTVWGKKPLFGVITSTPPHLANPDDAGKIIPAERLAVDIGFNEEKAKGLVSPGDMITFNGGFCEMLGDTVTSAGLDNKAGVAVILRALELLKDKRHNKKISVVFSVFEETGGGGACAASFGINPDKAIAVDVSFSDYPGAGLPLLGSGAMIGISPVLSREMSNELKSTASEKSIPFTLEVMNGLTSTNADKIAISGKGVKTALISIPLRCMHSAVETADVLDLESCARLIAEYIVREGKDDA